MAGLEGEFAKRGAKIIGLSVDPVENHARWAVRHPGRHRLPRQLPHDRRCSTSRSPTYNMLPCRRDRQLRRATRPPTPPSEPSSSSAPTRRSSCSSAIATTGRSFDEILRVLDSMQLTAKHKVATPANWKQGDDVIITGAMLNEEAAKTFPATRRSSPTSARPPNLNNPCTGIQTNAFCDGMKMRDVG